MKQKNCNPVCPYTKQDCIHYMKEDLNCRSCIEYGNGVRATGKVRLPTLKESIYGLLIIQVFLIILNIVNHEVSWWIIFLPILIPIVALMFAALVILFILIWYRDTESDKECDKYD